MYSTPICIEAHAHTCTQMHLKIQCPLLQGLQPHCLCLRPSKLSHQTEAPYLVAQVNFDVLLHQVQQLLGGTGE